MSGAYQSGRRAYKAGKPEKTKLKGTARQEWLDGYYDARTDQRLGHIWLRWKLPGMAETRKREQ